MSMTTKEKLSRLLHPTCAEDYGLVIDLKAVFREEPEMFAREFAPYLPAHVIEQCQPAQEAVAAIGPVKIKCPAGRAETGS